MNVIEKAVTELQQGHIILYPTDTVYGLGVDAFSAKAVTALENLKGRSDEKHFLIMLPNIDTINEYAVMSPAALELATKFLPGPLTLVLPAKDTLPSFLTHDGSIGIRIPDNQFCLELAEAFGRPFTTTSANVSGEDIKESIDEILQQFGEKANEISFIIRDGEKPIGKPSTIVRFVEDSPELIREGALSREDLGL